MRRIENCLYLLFSMLVVISTKVDAQSTLTWTDFEKVGDCFKGISVSYYRHPYMNKKDEFVWGVRFKNEYPVNVSFSYDLTVGKEKYPSIGFNVTSTIKTGEIFSETMILIKSKEEVPEIGITKVCFDNSKDCGKNGCYGKCDITPGRPNQPCTGNKKKLQDKTSDSEGDENSKEDPKTDISVMNGEWVSDDGQYTVITQVRGNGFDAWRKESPNFKAYYERISDNEYRYEHSSGTIVILKMINKNRLESLQNGVHFEFFTRH